MTCNYVSINNVTVVSVTSTNLRFSTQAADNQLREFLIDRVTQINGLAPLLVDFTPDPQLGDPSVELEAQESGPLYIHQDLAKAALSQDSAAQHIKNVMVLPPKWPNCGPMVVPTLVTITATELQLKFSYQGRTYTADLLTDESFAESQHVHWDRAGRMALRLTAAGRKRFKTGRRSLIKIAPSAMKVRGYVDHDRRLESDPIDLFDFKFTDQFSQELQWGEDRQMTLALTELGAAEFWVVPGSLRNASDELMDHRSKGAAATSESRRVVEHWSSWLGERKGNAAPEALRRLETILAASNGHQR